MSSGLAGRSASPAGKPGRGGGPSPSLGRGGGGALWVQRARQGSLQGHTARGLLPQSRGTLVSFLLPPGPGGQPAGGSLSGLCPPVPPALVWAHRDSPSFTLPGELCCSGWGGACREGGKSGVSKLKATNWVGEQLKTQSDPSAQSCVPAPPGEALVVYKEHLINLFISLHVTEVMLQYRRYLQLCSMCRKINYLEGSKVRCECV